MRPNAGRIKLFGEDVTIFHLTGERIVGLSRTYQIITLFPGDTLEHNVALGLLGLLPSRWQMWRPLSSYRQLPPKLAGRSVASASCIWRIVQYPN